MDTNVTAIETLVREHLQPMPTLMLAAAARGDVDLMTLVRAELAARGVDLDGNWIGFPEALRLHLGEPVETND